MNSKASRRYTTAIYEVAKDQGKLEEIAKDFHYVIGLINSNHDLELFFSSPVIPKSKKLEVVKTILTGRVSDLTMTFMILLLERRRGGLTLEILKDFIQLKKEKEGIADVVVKTSVELNDTEKASMKSKIDAYTKLNCILSFETDKTIIGGFVAKIHDTILDASIKRQLEILKNRFRQGDFSLN